MNSTLELLQRAAIRLSQDGSIKDRLADAYTSNLAELEPDELPESVRKDFAAMSEALHRERPLPRESVIRASIRKMSNEEAGRHAALIVRLFAVVARAETGDVAARRLSRAPLSPVVQLFAEG